MSLNPNVSRNTGTGARQPVNDTISRYQIFDFLPKELTAKCLALVESYHSMHGYVGLPDMLWLSDARDVIECDRELTEIFQKAAKSRGAKRANDSFLLIATVIVSLEVLARDFADWGKRFPKAKREAEKLLGDFPRRRRCLMDFYLYPGSAARHQLATALAPPAEAPALN
jgi:hypothetical protein